LRWLPAKLSKSGIPSSARSNFKRVMKSFQEFKGQSTRLDVTGAAEFVARSEPHPFVCSVQDRRYF